MVGLPLAIDREQHVVGVEVAGRLESVRGLHLHAPAELEGEGLAVFGHGPGLGEAGDHLGGSALELDQPVVDVERADFHVRLDGLLLRVLQQRERALDQQPVDVEHLRCTARARVRRTHRACTSAAPARGAHQQMPRLHAPTQPRAQRWRLVGVHLIGQRKLLWVRLGAERNSRHRCFAARHPRVRCACAVPSAAGAHVGFTRLSC